MIRRTLARPFIETAGALVAVIGSAVGVYLKLYPKKETDKKPGIGAIAGGSLRRKVYGPSGLSGPLRAALYGTGPVVPSNSDPVRDRLEEPVRWAHTALTGCSSAFRGQSAQNNGLSVVIAGGDTPVINDGILHVQKAGDFEFSLAIQAGRTRLGLSRTRRNDARANEARRPVRD
jgi:hypothetical protein